MKRREFLGGMFAAAAASTVKAGEVFQGWSKGSYQIHFIHTGVAESMLHIFPDGSTMLLDCGDMAAITRDKSVPVVPGPNKLSGEWVSRYIKRVLPPGTPMQGERPVIDTMMLSHFHADHCGTPRWQANTNPINGCVQSGFGIAAKHFTFRKAIDRGWPTYDEPRTVVTPWDHELEHMKGVYGWLQKRDGLQIERARLGEENVHGVTIRTICVNGKILRRDGTVRDLYAADKRKYLNENGMSIGMIITFGKFKYFTAGDFSDNAIGADGKLFATEDVLAEVVERVNVAKVNHHGHYSMPPKLVSALAPQVWTSCVWDQLHNVDPVLLNLTDRKLYPSERMIFPTVFPNERIEEARAKNRIYLKDIAPETLGTGAHIVVNVPSNATEYTVTCIDARDESMRVLRTYRYPIA